MRTSAGDELYGEGDTWREALANLKQQALGAVERAELDLAEVLEILCSGRESAAE